ncbi:MAG: dethiobiotin synthase [Lacipirellulaceae bacterium]
MPTLFITGTSTEVGKTHIGAMIARSLVASGESVGVYKPVASGCRLEGAELIADDALALWEAAGEPRSLDEVCPQKFLAALSPPTAAAQEGKTVDTRLLRTGIEIWRQNYDRVLVEGAGGLMSPLSDSDFNADMARDLGAALLIVAANRLGVINDTLQTVITAKARTPECPLVGVVLNQVEPRTDDASLATNAVELSRRLREFEVPLLASAGFGEESIPGVVDWRSVF